MKKYQKSQNEKRALRLGKAVGCKVAERVRHTDECPARIEKTLDDERTATKREASVGESVDVSVYTPLHTVTHSSSVNPRKTLQRLCDLAPGCGF